MLEVEVRGIGAIGGQFRHDLGDRCLVNTKPLHERVFRHRVRDRGRLLNAAAVQESRHGQYRATRCHMPQELPAFDRHGVSHVNIV